MALEEPKFKTIKKFDRFELRQYEGHLVAEVQIEGEFDDVGNKAFRILASYIFGKNKSSTKMAMTAPVSQINRDISLEDAMVRAKEQNSGTFKIQFMMPSKYSMESLPKPKDDQVKIIKVPPRLVAEIGRAHV